MKYLIVKCKPLGVPYESDVNRFPLRITDHWEENAPKEGYYEVYIIDEKTGDINKKIKNWNEEIN